MITINLDIEMARKTAKLLGSMLDPDCLLTAIAINDAIVKHELAHADLNDKGDE